MALNAKSARRQRSRHNGRHFKTNCRDCQNLHKDKCPRIADYPPPHHPYRTCLRFEGRQSWL